MRGWMGGKREVRGGWEGKRGEGVDGRVRER